MRLKNGTILFLSPNGNKVIDLMITSAFPMISLNPRGTKVIDSDGKELEIGHYDHFSIPPDLKLHFKENQTKKYINFDLDLIDYKTGFLKNNQTHLFSWFSGPVLQYEPFRGTRHQAVLLCLTPDLKFSSHTGLFIDFFVHNMPNEKQILDYPFFKDSCRLIGLGNEDSAILGPHGFEEIIRGKFETKPKFLFSIRFGFYEAINEVSQIFVPFKLRLGWFEKLKFFMSNL